MNLHKSNVFAEKYKKKVMTETNPLKIKAI